ncbi:hypothetical protein MBLNU230_g7339t1 [Neophaeotheca triangularis]
MAAPKIEDYPYPAPLKTRTTHLTNPPTPLTATLHSFTDKLLLTLQTPFPGTLTHWLHVPLASATPLDPTASSTAYTNPDEGNELLPMAHLTATTVLGGTKEEEEVLGQTLAVMVASAVLTRRPGEERLLVLGLGLPRGFGGEGEEFEKVVGVCLDCL